ncbi:MAG: hypothetical protein AAFV96_13310 [Pseudomonadota bacterium]
MGILDDMPDIDEARRLPGLFRAWELGQVLAPGHGYRIEAAGETRDGAALVAVFRLSACAGEAR